MKNNNEEEEMKRKYERKIMKYNDNMTVLMKPMMTMTMYWEVIYWSDDDESSKYVFVRENDWRRAERNWYWLLIQ